MTSQFQSDGGNGYIVQVMPQDVNQAESMASGESYNFIIDAYDANDDFVGETGTAVEWQGNTLDCSGTDGFYTKTADDADADANPVRAGQSAISAQSISAVAASEGVSSSGIPGAVGSVSAPGPTNGDVDYPCDTYPESEQTPAHHDGAPYVHLVWSGPEWVTINTEHIWDDMSEQFTYASGTNTTIKTGFSLDGDHWSVGADNSDEGEKKSSYEGPAQVSKQDTDMKASFQFHETELDRWEDWNKSNEHCQVSYTLYPVEWNGDTEPVKLTTTSPGDGCNMAVDTRRFFYQNGGTEHTYTSAGHEYSAGASIFGYSVHTSTEYTTESEVEWKFGASGGVTNNYDYLCWISAHDSIATATGWIYSYSNNSPKLSQISP